jgi:hypothetical protein
LKARGAITTMPDSPAGANPTQHNFSNAAFKAMALHFLFHAWVGKIHGSLPSDPRYSGLYHILLVLRNTL